MTCDEKKVPKVWICLRKIRAYVDGVYQDKKDVYCCIDTLERLFEDVPVKVEAQAKMCRNGWEDDVPGPGI